jgi:hypothetical protein
MLVGRVEKLSPSDTTESPFRFGETLLYPSMGEPFRKAQSPALGFYFLVFGGSDSGGPKKATIEVYRADQPVGRVTADLPAADATGRIQYAGSLPLQPSRPARTVSRSPPPTALASTPTRLRSPLRNDVRRSVPPVVTVREG